MSTIVWPALEVGEPIEHECEPEVNVRRRRVDAELDAQRASELQLPLELPLRQHIDGMTREVQLARRPFQVLDRNRLELVCRLEPEHLREEREMRLERLLHVLRLAESVPLAL